MIKNKKGFTLIELIVVISVLAVLAVVAVPMVSDWTGKAENSAAQANARTIELAVKAYMAEEGITVFGLSLSQGNGGSEGREPGNGGDLGGISIGEIGEGRIPGGGDLGGISEGEIGEGRIPGGGDLGGISEGEIGGGLRPPIKLPPKLELDKILPKFGISNPIPNSKSDYKVSLDGKVTVENIGKGSGNISVKKISDSEMGQE